MGDDERIAPQTPREKTPDTAEIRLPLTGEAAERSEAEGVPRAVAACESASSADPLSHAKIARDSSPLQGGPKGGRKRAALVAACCALVAALAVGAGVAGGAFAPASDEAAAPAGAVSDSGPALEEEADADASQSSELALEGEAGTSDGVAEGVNASDDDATGSNKASSSKKSKSKSSSKASKQASKKSSSSGKSSSSSASKSAAGTSDSADAAETASITVSVAVDSSRAASYGYPESLYSGELTLDAGSTAYDALVATGLAFGGTKTYIRSISGLAEFSCGSGSGWLYRVNGVFPKKTVGDYTLSAGDSIEFIYTVDMGNDV